MEKNKIIPTEKPLPENIFQTNAEAMFNASAVAKHYNKEVFGFTRGQKVKDLVKSICHEYQFDFDKEFTPDGKVVRINTGGTSPGTWMHFDIYIEFVGWLDPKLKRTFFSNIIASGNTTDPLQTQLAETEAQITLLKRKLSRNTIYKQLKLTEQKAKRLTAEIEKRDKLKRKNQFSTNQKLIK